jgi:hypothetical protein
MTVTVERVSGRDTLAIGLVIDGRQCVVSLGSSTKGGRGSGIEMIDNRFIFQNGTMNAKPVFDNGPVTIECAVRRSRITVRCDGKILIDWEGSANRLSTGKVWNVAQKDELFLGDWDAQYRITELTLTPVRNDQSR